MPRRLPARARRGALLSALALLLAVAGCASEQALTYADAGKTTQYQVGEPAFDLDVRATRRDQLPGVEVRVGVAPAVLAFAQSASAFDAVIERSWDVLDAADAVVFSTTKVDTVRVPTYAVSRGTTPRVFAGWVPLKPGTYTVRALVRDRQTDRLARREMAVEVPRVEASVPFITSLRVAERSADGFTPLLPFHVPARPDSLFAWVEVHGAADGLALTFEAASLPTDRAVAAPPYHFSPMRGALGYRGVAHDKPERLQQTTRTVEAGETAVEVAFALPPMEPGMHRLRLQARHGDSLVHEQDRLVSFSSPTFPHVRLLADMTEALEYLARPVEMERLRAGDSTDARQAFDTFWGNVVGDREKALRTMRTYFARVEEANLRFTTHKDGWRTDMGMVYIVLGPPILEEALGDEVVWHYRYGDADGRFTYRFERVRPYVPGIGFAHYVLQRNAAYEEPWLRAVRAWREGRPQ